LRLTIEKLVYGGDGLARLPADEKGRAKSVFIPFVLAGETIEASLTEQKSSFARGRAEKILQSSPNRIEPACPYFNRCGGCQYQHTSYDNQLEIKAAILKENLRRIAKIELDTELTVHPSPEWNYRNRVRMQVRSAPEFALGYYKFNSHDLLPVDQCPIASPLINRAIAGLWELGRSGKIATGIQEIELFVDAEDTEFLVQLHAGEIRRHDSIEVAEEIRSALPAAVGISISRTLTGKTPEQLATIGADALVYRALQGSYRVSHGAFFQTNRHLIDELITIVTAGRSGRLALDLYAGAGLFSKALGQSFPQVIAVESSPTSQGDLVHNSPHNVKAVLKTTERYLEGEVGKLQPNLVVVDPPRGGLGETVVRDLKRLGAERITYVSCDPATLSRDLVGLLGCGYRIEQAHFVDLFPQTFHIESVFQLVR